MPAEEFYQWMVFAQMEPFGDRRGDWNAAYLMSTMANIHRDPKGNTYKTTDFLIDWWPKPKPEPVNDSEEQMKWMLFMQASQNALVAAEHGETSA